MAEPPAAAFTCATCSKTFPSSTRYHKHLQTHSDVKFFKCYYPGCDKAYTRKTHLTRHLLVHTAERPHECDVEGCGLSFATRQKLEKHKTSHEGLRCDACGSKFKKRVKLELHRARVHGEVVENPVPSQPVGDVAEPVGQSQAVADASTRSSSSPSRPLPRDCDSSTKEARHACEECDERFVRFLDLVAHRRDMHPKAHVCPECGKAYRKADSLREHQQRVHAETVVLCPQAGCGQTFSSVSNMRVHQRVAHRGLRPFECRDCGESFGYRHVLNRHVQLAHNPGAADGSARAPRRPTAPRATKAIKRRPAAVVCDRPSVEEAQRLLDALAPVELLEAAASSGASSGQGPAVDLGPDSPAKRRRWNHASESPAAAAAELPDAPSPEPASPSVSQSKPSRSVDTELPGGGLENVQLALWVPPGSNVSPATPQQRVGRNRANEDRGAGAVAGPKQKRKSREVKPPPPPLWPVAAAAAKRSLHDKRFTGDPFGILFSTLRGEPI